MNKQKDFELEMATLRAEIAMIRQERNVNGFLSAVVRTSPEVFDAIMYSFAGGVIGIPAAIAWTAMGNDPAGTLYMWGACQSFGVTCAGVRLACAAIDLPLIIEGVAQKVLESRERRDERKAQEKNSTREVPVYSRGEQTGYLSIPEPTPFKVKTLRIPSVNVSGDIREIEVDKVCLFLKSAVASGNWSRDTQTVLNKKEHPDVKAYLTGRGWWKLNPPALHRACAILRAGGTNGDERDGTNGGTI